MSRIRHLEDQSIQYYVDNGMKNFEDLKLDPENFSDSVCALLYELGSVRSNSIKVCAGPTDIAEEVPNQRHVQYFADSRMTRIASFAKVATFRSELLPLR